MRLNINMTSILHHPRWLHLFLHSAPLTDSSLRCRNPSNYFTDLRLCANSPFLSQIFHSKVTQGQKAMSQQQSRLWQWRMSSWLHRLTEIGVSKGLRSRRNTQRVRLNKAPSTLDSLWTTKAESAPLNPSLSPDQRWDQAAGKPLKGLRLNGNTFNLWP